MSPKYPNFDGTQPCASIHPEVYFQVEGEGRGDKQGYGDNKMEANIIKKVSCNHCSFINECLEWAIHNEEYGIWGGTTEMERRTLRRQSGIDLRTIQNRENVKWREMIWEMKRLQELRTSESNSLTEWQ